MSQDDGRGGGERSAMEGRADEPVEFPGRSPTTSLRLALVLAVALMLLALAAVVVNFL